VFGVHHVFVVHDEDYLPDDVVHIYLHLIRLFLFHIHFGLVQEVNAIHIVLVQVSVKRKTGRINICALRISTIHQFVVGNLD
jgi:hypothetical protein